MQRPFVVLLAAAALLAAAPAAHAADPAVVTLGDSFMSGEAGRWHGNFNASGGNRGGTDRAFRDIIFHEYDASRVYGDTAASGCHRSDVAEGLSAVSGRTVALNIACSGAETINVLRSPQGGRGFKGEAPQGDQLARLANRYDVQAVVLSIGGNDLGFSGIISDCVTGYVNPFAQATCNGYQQAVLNQQMPLVMSNVRHVIDSVRSAMTMNGYTADDYRFVLQSYPSPVPASGDLRYPQGGWSRTEAGCPMWDVDLDWANRRLVPQIADQLRAVAAAERVEFLDLRDLFDGHEVCSKHTEEGGYEPAASLQWARAVSFFLQGDQQESMHPNEIGQRAMGQCLRLLLAREDGLAYACRAGIGVAPGDVRLSVLKGRPPVDPARERPKVDDDLGPEDRTPWPSRDEWGSILANQADQQR